MANRSKAKGTRAETQVVKYLTACGFSAERMALHGNQDMGDVKVTDQHGNVFVLEVKAGQQTANPSRAQLTEWIRQTVVESSNSGLPCHLVVVRYRRSLKDAEVYTPQEEQTSWCYLDDFVNKSR